MNGGVRRLTTADEPLLWEMLYLAIYVPPGAGPPDPEIVRRPELARYVQGWGRSGDLGLAALSGTGGNTIGAAWVRLFPADARGYGFVDANTPELSIALRSSWRGQGSGSTLLTALLEVAASQYPAVSLSVSRENPAVRLYRRHGFEVVDERDGSLVMAARLPRPA
jgi:ribosomal protein S18 acetylase RimI-like enzyme